MSRILERGVYKAPFTENRSVVLFAVDRTGEVRQTFYVLPGNPFAESEAVQMLEAILDSVDPDLQLVA